MATGMAAPRSTVPPPIVRAEIRRFEFMPLMAVYSLVSEALDANVSLADLRDHLGNELTRRVPASAKENAATADTVTALLDGRSTR